MLPQSSVAVQVRVTLYVPAHEPCVVASVNVTVTVASHASVAVGAVNTGTAGQLTGLICVAHTRVGGVLSITRIVALQDELLPQSSVPVQVRVTLYVPAQEPCVVASENVTVTDASHASVAIGGVKTGTAGQLTGVV